MPPKKMSAEEMAWELLRYVSEHGARFSNHKEVMDTFKAALRQAHAAGRDEAFEEAACLIQDWHVPSKGGTHEMAFKIRALKTPEGGK